MEDKVIATMGLILEELLSFDGQIEELCAMSEAEGEFVMSGSDMINFIRSFVEHSKAFR